MKFHLTVIALFFVSSISLAQEALDTTKEMTTAIIEVEGMACQEGCADKINSNLNETTGIASAAVSYEKKEAIVRFDPEIISIKDIERVITQTKVKEYVYTIGKTTIKE